MAGQTKPKCCTTLVGAAAALPTAATNNSIFLFFVERRRSGNTHAVGPTPERPYNNNIVLYGDWPHPKMRSASPPWPQPKQHNQKIINFLLFFLVWFRFFVFFWSKIERPAIINRWAPDQVRLCNIKVWPIASLALTMDGHGAIHHCYRFRFAVIRLNHCALGIKKRRPKGNKKIIILI